MLCPCQITDLYFNWDCSGKLHGIYSLSFQLLPKTLFCEAYKLQISPELCLCTNER